MFEHGSSGHIYTISDKEIAITPGLPHIIENIQREKIHQTKIKDPEQEYSHKTTVKHHIAVVEKQQTYHPGGIQNYQCRPPGFMPDAPISRSYAPKGRLPAPPNPDISLPGPGAEVGPPAGCWGGPAPIGSRLNGRNHALGW